ncbi:golgin candidate 5 isoform X9 [Drosophila simulans]|uniref:golgin candidate 5 isoform X9 n=1 Tax=Drosophila simulans TaxID=7240 RepID=UPI00192D11C8|nr:golgin candidate 5 isoform X9 [Drosophila simulans]
MYEKTLNIGTAKVNNAYEWQKVRYNNKPQPTTTTAAAVKPKPQQQQAQKQKNATKAAPATTTAATTTATVPPLAGNSVTVKQGPKIKFVGNAARRQSLAHQIKRAHRHLLTSGGQDKQPQQKQKTQVQPQSGKTVAKPKQRQQKQLFKSDKAKEKFSRQQRKRGGTRSTRNPRTQSESSGLSSRWISIEEQLNLLDDLLYYCDEEAELYLAQLYERFETLRRSRSSSPVSDFWSDSDMEHDDSSTSGTGRHTASNTSLVPASLKRRGHQHHPRFSGTRRPNVPNVQEILAALYRGDSKSALSNLRGETQPEEEQPQQQPEEMLPPSRSTLSLPLSESVTNSLGSNSPTPTDESSVQDEGASNPAAASIAEDAAPPAATTTSKSKKKKREKGERSEKSEKSEKSDRKKKSSSKKERSKRSNPMELSSDSLATDLSAGTIDEGIALADDDDNQAAEWSKLRCTSEAAEIVAEREARRNKGRCADYPGLAFGRSIFSSDTMMKFNIIRNELHNIMNTQLKRAESEVAALNRRIQLLEEDLERSEERLGSATAKLSEASQAADESERIRKALENRTNMEDDKVALLENQLAQAKLIAEEADKKYEEVARKLVLMEQDLERSEEKVELSESKIVELEEELRVVGNNLKSLEVSEEKANQREEEYKNQIKTLNTRLKEAEARAEFAERSVQKLQKEVDRLEDDLLNVRGKNKLLQEEMEATLHDIQNM